MSSTESQYQGGQPQFQPPPPTPPLARSDTSLSPASKTIAHIAHGLQTSSVEGSILVNWKTGASSIPPPPQPDNYEDEYGSGRLRESKYPLPPPHVRIPSSSSSSASSSSAVSHTALELTGVNGPLLTDLLKTKSALATRAADVETKQAVTLATINAKNDTLRYLIKREEELTSRSAAIRALASVDTTQLTKELRSGTITPAAAIAQLRELEHDIQLSIGHLGTTAVAQFCNVSHSLHKRKRDSDEVVVIPDSQPSSGDDDSTSPSSARAAKEEDEESRVARKRRRISDRQLPALNKKRQNLAIEAAHIEESQMALFALWDAAAKFNTHSATTGHSIL